MSEEPHIYDWYQPSWGEKVDLNDPKTYEEGWFKEHMSLNAEELQKEIRNQIGYSLWYMICWQPDTDWDEKHHDNPGQYSRVVEFGRHFSRESHEPDRRENVPWLRKQLFLIRDETENQC